MHGRRPGPGWASGHSLAMSAPQAWRIPAPGPPWAKLDPANEPARAMARPRVVRRFIGKLRDGDDEDGVLVLPRCFTRIASRFRRVTIAPHQSQRKSAKR